MPAKIPPTRVYSNRELAVEWRPELCEHCRNCVIELPKVFDTNARPWVNMDGGTTEDIRRVVDDCPSGALVSIELRKL